MRSDLEYLSTKTYTHSVGLSCCFRQWRADSHCKYLHGYALEVKLTFRAQILDKNGWVVDFGGLKEIKQWLENTFDHRLLVAGDDPLLPTFEELRDRGIADVAIVRNVGVEAFAELIYTRTEQWIDNNLSTQGRVVLETVEVKEHGANSAIVRRKG